jgi:hypothetical protein
VPKRKDKKVKDMVPHDSEDHRSELFPLQMVSVQMEHSEDEDFPENALYPEVNIVS